MFRRRAGKSVTQRLRPESTATALCRQTNIEIPAHAAGNHTVCGQSDQRIEEIDADRDNCCKCLSSKKEKTR
jgi:hypothetical protein